MFLAVLPSLALAESRQFNIAAGNAADALASFARQADVQILFDAGEVAGQRTAAVAGELAPRRALRRMLSGTQLTFEFTDPRTVAVFHKKSRRGPEATDVVPVPLTLNPKLPHFLPEVNVTAQRTRGDLVRLSGVGEQEFAVADLMLQGIETPMDWLRTVPENFGGGATEDTRLVGREAPTNTAFGSGANLRGLGSRATLILVDGRRLAPSGSAGTFTDIFGIPLSAIDHIQIVDAGIAPLYGTDAVGGVINFVLRGQSVPETQASYGGVTRGSLGEQLYSQSLFLKGDDQSAMLSAEYFERDALPASARAQATSDLRSFGGQNLDIPYGNPGTIIDAAGQTWAIPAVASGSQPLQRPLSAGTENLYDQYQDAQILPQQKRWSVLGTYDYHIDPDTRVFADVLFSHREVRSRHGGLVAMVSVPGDNPFAVRPTDYVNAPNDDSIGVLYGFGNDVGPLRLEGTVQSRQVVAGLLKEFPSQWTVNAYVGWAREQQADVQEGLVDFGNLQQALDDPAAATSFNAFGGSNADSVSHWSIGEVGHVHYDSSYIYSDVSVLHPLLTLAGAPLTLTSGVDFRVQSFKSEASPSNLSFNPATDRKRETTALYTELQAPILPGRVGSSPALSASGGLRYEHYSDVGHVLTPQLGIDYLPAPGWKLQGSWAKLYRAPNLPDMTESTNFSTVALLPDAHSATGASNALLWSGGNQGLRPETAHSWSLGLTFAPGDPPHASTSLGYFHIVFQDRIADTRSLPFDVLSNPQDVALVDRDVTDALRQQVCSRSHYVGLAQDCLGAPIAAVVDLRLRNLDTLRTDGIDLKNVTQFPIARGEFKLTTSATYLLHYRERDTPSTPLLELRNTPHNPLNLYLSSTATFQRRRFWMSATANYQGAYEDIDSPSPRHVASWTTLDGAIGWRLRWFGDSTAQTEISLSGQNLFNRNPPALNNVAAAIGYDQENGDLLGRRVSITLRQRW